MIASLSWPMRTPEPPAGETVEEPPELFGQSGPGLLLKAKDVTFSAVPFDWTVPPMDPVLQVAVPSEVATDTGSMSVARILPE